MTDKEKNDMEDLRKSICMREISDILLDIEGTTCPVNFVTQVLFPYAISHLSEFLESHGHTDTVKRLVAEIEQAWQQDKDEEACILRSQRSRSMVAYLQLLMRQDRKLPPLKELQGLIWHQGYANGDLRVNLYDDVPATLDRWHRAGLKIAVYSSGSISAQQLLYGHTDSGDLRPLFTGWFDTRIGSKIEADSYRKIASSLQTKPNHILFISDSQQEANAAREAGIKTVICTRSEDARCQPLSNPSLQRSIDLASIHVTPIGISL